MASEPKRLFPLFLDLERRLVVVVGGGPAAVKRVRQLAKYGADVVVIVEEPSADLAQAEADGLASIETRAYQDGDLAGAYLVVCSDDDPEVVAAVTAEAEQRACPLSVASNHELSTFIFPSVVRRGALQAAFSTAGAAPPIAKAARIRIESQLSDAWAAWIQLYLDVRRRGHVFGEDEAARSHAFAAVADVAMLERLEAGEDLTVNALVAEAIAAAGAPDEAAAADGIDRTEGAEGAKGDASQGGAESEA